jgi:hypothetical protein
MDKFSKEMEQLHKDIDNLRAERLELQTVYNQADVTLAEFYRHMDYAREYRG